MVSIPAVGQLLGHYRIVEQIGAGGMGVVFPHTMRRWIAMLRSRHFPGLTLLSESARHQFRREALSLARITDPHVAMAFEFGEDTGTYYLVTEYVARSDAGGKTRRAHPSGSGGPATGQAARIRSGGGAQRRGRSRDLKPGNLKVTPDGRPEDPGFWPGLHVEERNRHGGDGPADGNLFRRWDFALHVAGTGEGGQAGRLCGSVVGGNGLV